MLKINEEEKKARSLAYIDYAKQYSIDACVCQLEKVFEQAIADERKNEK